MAQTQMGEGANLAIHFPRAITQTLYGYKVGYPTLHKLSSPSLLKIFVHSYPQFFPSYCGIFLKMLSSIQYLSLRKNVRIGSYLKGRRDCERKKMRN